MGSSNTLVKIRLKIRRNYKIAVFLLPIVFIPLLASASVFSFFSSLFSTTPALAQGSEQNVQNMPLLQATISPLVYASTTDNEVFIVQGNSLSKESLSAIDVKTFEDDLISLYVVRTGDTLPAIAKMFNVSVNTIKWANDLKSNSVSVGQTLVILPITGIKHIVKSGDSISSIAKQHKGDVDEIMQYNNLTKGSILAIGDEIIVPDGEASVVYSSGVSSVSVKTGSSYPIYEGYYMRPIIGGVKTQGVHGHNGVDLASSYGSNILASAEGEVIISRSSGWNGGYGSYVVIKHGNGTQTLYAHLSGTAVSVGSSVKQGQVIGYMGRSGQVTGHTGIHLHFEIRGARNPF
ncbi:MAG TPA: peptidoglycan DD-metalloendopeptidase family protein [Candidatus Paceibacterota bacterium]